AKHSPPGATRRQMRSSAAAALSAPSGEGNRWRRDAPRDMNAGAADARSGQLKRRHLDRAVETVACPGERGNAAPRSRRQSGATGGVRKTHAAVFRDHSTKLIVTGYCVSA